MLRKRYACRWTHGHLFSHSFWWWYNGGPFTVVRLGFGAYMHCPVGDHWSVVRPVKKHDLTEQERETLRLREGLDDQDGVKLSGLIGLFVGVGSLIGAIVDQSRWGALGSAIWIVVWGGAFLRARRVLSSS